MKMALAEKRRRSRRGVDNRRIAQVLRRLRVEYDKREAPVVTFIAASTQSPYHVLVGCILSLRTQDATTAAAAERLFAFAPDVHALARARVARVRKAIYPVGFYRTKATRLVAMAKRIVREFDARVPDDIDTLLELDGVGRKTANLVVTAGYGKPGICVDTHVHRISNRWGHVATKIPEHTEAALRRKLPRAHWRHYNDLLVAFGQTICRPIGPRCERCPVESWCPSSRLVAVVASAPAARAGSGADAHVPQRRPRRRVSA
jgi:endonuclease-3